MIEVFIKGFLISFSLIVAIGAQNAYVLKLGLLKKYVFVSVLFCSLSDLVLMSAGVLGVGFFIKGNQTLINIIAIFGIVFLTSYAFLSFKSALKNESMKVKDDNQSLSYKKVLLTLSMFTFLNPHVYLDTVLLVGGIGANYEGNLKLFYLLGTATASFVWFFLLGYGARVLIPIFKKPITWKILDIIIGIVMLSIAFSLISMIKF